ncbi:NACHT domain-containing protein [Streptomyces parvus]|uniref:NACHT domain-containing protein n=2 Tax=Streptomyces TaxID=1883 RepID=UPI003629236E
MRYAWRRSLRPLHETGSRERALLADWHYADPQLHLDELDAPVVVLLGERGMGKSVTLEQERIRLQEQGASVTWLNLGKDVFDISTAGSALLDAFHVPEEASEHYVLLDSLDEGLSDVPGLAKVLAHKLAEVSLQQRARIRLRITCRTTRWPESLEDELRRLWTGEHAVTLMALAPLSLQDMQIAAEAHHLDGAEFTEMINSRGLTALAQQPVTLIPLLKACENREPLPETVVEAYQQACRRLCTETRQEGSEHQSRPAADHLLEVARWVAAALQFSSATALVDHEPAAEEIDFDTLSGPTVPGSFPEQPCRREELRYLTQSGLFTPVGRQRWTFAHRTYQEHLAAEFLRDHTAPAVRAELLWAGSGEARHILPQHEEVAARLCMDDPNLLDDLIAHHLRTALLADLPALPTARRRQVTQALLESARNDTYDIHDIYDRFEADRLSRLNHPQLAEQLTPSLKPGMRYDETLLALAITDRCQLPGLTPTLITLAEDTATSVRLRSFALDVTARRSGHDQDTLTRLDHLSRDDDEVIAAAALNCLRALNLPLTEFFDRLPLGSAQRYVWRADQLTELIAPHDADEALDWATAEIEARTPKAMIALSVLEQAIQLISQADLDHPNQSLSHQKAGHALLTLASHPDLLDRPEAYVSLENLSDTLHADPPLRHHLAEYVLLHGQEDHAKRHIHTPEAGLFPDDDLLYWAERWTDLPDPARRAAQSLFTNRPRPADESLRQAVERARQVDPQLHASTAWWDNPPPEWLRDREERRNEQRRQHAFDQNDFTTALAAVRTAAPDQVRATWFAVLVELAKTADGSKSNHAADLSAAATAPSCPPEGTALRTDLATLGLRVLSTAPPWNTHDTPVWGAASQRVPELTAAALVTAAEWESAVPISDTPRWAGWALALATMTPLADEQELHRALFNRCASHAGVEFGTLLVSCLDNFESHELTELTQFLYERGATEALDLVRDWAAAPGRPHESWAAVFTSLIRVGDDTALAQAQTLLETTTTDRPETKKRWITMVHTQMQSTTLPDIWPHVRRAFDEQSALFHALVDTLVTQPDRAYTTSGMAALTEDDLADFYARLCQRHELRNSRPEPDPETTVPPHNPAKAIHDFADEVARLIASKGTRQAADQLTCLAASGTAHNPERLSAMARRTARQAARQQVEPLPASQLRKLATDHALRVINDETQLLDVVMEALDRVQEALSAPNGMAILLWSRSTAKGINKMWPAWEEDFSDLVMGLLKLHLTGRQIVLNREVQVDRPGSGPGAGRTDIHIQATLHSQTEPITVVIECKGCWNPELKTALPEQLVDRYLRRPHTAGIFLVGFFDCDLWDPDSRENCRSKHNKETIERHQRKLAAEHPVPVRARVLDCRPPAVQNTRPETSR